MFLIPVLCSLALLPMVPSEEIEQWIQMLGSRRYALREKAGTRLLAIGKPAMSALKEALDHEDLEVRRRARGLLKQLYHRYYGPIRSFTGHSDYVITVNFSPDGRYAISGGRDKSARVWDVTTGKELHRFMHKGAVWAVAISGDSRRALTGTSSNEMALWDLENGQKIREFTGHTRAVRCLRFSPNGKRAASGSYDKKLRLWEVETGKLLYAQQEHVAGIMCLDYANNGSSIITSGSKNDRTVRLWEAETGKLLKTLSGHEERIMGTAFSNDCQWIASGAWDQTVRVWDRQSGREVQQFSLKVKVNKVRFTPSGKQIIAGCYDGIARLLDRKSGKVLHQYNGHSKAIKSVAMHPNGKQFLTGGADHQVLLWPLH